MKKIPSLFERDRKTGRVINTVVPGSEWAANGEGVATRKWDGTACLVEGHRLYKRYDAKHGKTPPDGFVPAQDADPVTGHWPGWVRVGNGPEDRWHREAFARFFLPDGTYEMIGPKIGGNPERVCGQCFMRHGEATYDDVPRDYRGLMAWLERHEIEGVVFHHPDGRMVKAKRRDFGLEWPVRH